MTYRLHKSTTNRVIAGVCGGLGEYFNVDPTIVRIVFVVLTIWGGLGILLYLILLVIMPEANSKTPTPDPGLVIKRIEARHWIGGGLIIFGALLLTDTLNNVYNIFPAFQLGQFIWPLVIIYLGIWFIHSQRSK